MMRLTFKPMAPGLKVPRLSPCIGPSQTERA